MKFGGLKFLEAAHVKDLLSILRWAENPIDPIAGFRVVQFSVQHNHVHLILEARDRAA